MSTKRTMVNRNEFGSLLYEEDVRDQIRIRRDLMNQMVGSLYPSILADEIDELHQLNRPARPKENIDGEARGKER